MLTSSQLLIETAKIHVRRMNFDDQNSVAVSKDLITGKIKKLLKEENIDYDALDKLCTLYTALKAVYDSFEN